MEQVEAVFSGHRGDNDAYRRYVLSLAERAGRPEVRLAGGGIVGGAGERWELFTVAGYGAAPALMAAEEQLERLLKGAGK